MCSRHFKPEDIREPASETARRLLKRGSVPELSEWNNFFLPLPRPGVWERRQSLLSEDDSEANAPDNVAEDVSMDHDYVSAPDPVVVDLVLEENASLREEIRQLRGQVESLTLRRRFSIHHFAASDKDIRFFTR